MKTGLLIAVFAAAPPASELQSFELKPSTSSAKAADCATISPDEVVVCAKRERKYRLDPAALAAARARNALPAAPDKAAALANAKSCSSGIGPHGCTGTKTIDFVAIGLLAAKAALTAAQGEDWRETFRTRPDEYDEYRAAKEQEARMKPKVKLEFGGRRSAAAARP